MLCSKLVPQETAGAEPPPLLGQHSLPLGPLVGQGIPPGLTTVQVTPPAMCPAAVSHSYCRGSTRGEHDWAGHGSEGGTLACGWGTVKTWCPGEKPDPDGHVSVVPGLGVSAITVGMLATREGAAGP